MYEHEPNNDRYTEDANANIDRLQHLTVSIDLTFLALVAHALSLLDFKVFIFNYALDTQHHLAHTSYQVEVCWHGNEHYHIDINRVVDPLVHEENYPERYNAERACVEREDGLPEFLQFLQQPHIS